MKKQTELIIMSAIQTQSLLHTLDKMDDANPYKMQKKKALNLFMSQVNNLVKVLELHQNEFCDLLRDADTKEFDVRQSQNFIECVQRFDDLADSVNLIGVE